VRGGGGIGQRGRRQQQRQKTGEDSHFNS
jgi:hypothetical protein